MIGQDNMVVGLGELEPHPNRDGGVGIEGVAAVGIVGA